MPRLLLLAALLFAPNALPAETEIARSVANNGQLVMEDVPPIRPDLVAELRRYQSMREASFAGFVGDELLISTRFGELNQIHRVSTALGMRRQLTFVDELIRQVAVQPGGRRIAFTLDRGGSEDTQIYVWDMASGNEVMVSDGESRNGALNWSRTGEKLAYTSTRRDGASNDIWVARVDGEEPPAVVLEATDGYSWAASDWSSDADTLLVQHYVGSTESDLSLLDLDSGEKRELSGADGQSRNLAVGFGPDDRGVFYLTDKNSDYLQLVYRELSENAVDLIVTRDIPWDVSAAVMSDDRKRMAFAVNREGYSDLYLLDPASRRYERVKAVPPGVIGTMDFNADGTLLGLTLSRPDSPADVFVLALEGALSRGEVTQWTDSETGGLDRSRFVRPELVRYPTFDDVGTIPAFVYRPRADGPHPVVVAIHGGPEGQYRPTFSAMFQMWVDKLGVAVIAPNVRGSAGYGKRYLALDNGRLREDSVRDIGALLDWIATQPDLDEKRVAVYGGSYGGYMVLASSVHYSERLAAAVDIVGISNFVTFLTNTRSYRRDLRRFEYGDERDPEMRKFLEQISPLNQVEKIRIPLFVVQGQNDPRVPVTEAEQIVARVRDRGEPVWYMNALNEGHGYRRKENRDVFQQAVVQFFQENLLK